MRSKTLLNLRCSMHGHHGEIFPDACARPPKMFLKNESEIIRPHCACPGANLFVFVPFSLFKRNWKFSQGCETVFDKNDRCWSDTVNFRRRFATNAWYSAAVSESRSYFLHSIHWKKGVRLIAHWHFNICASRSQTINIVAVIFSYFEIRRFFFFWLGQRIYNNLQI